MFPQPIPLNVSCQTLSGIKGEIHGGLIVLLATDEKKTGNGGFSSGDLGTRWSIRLMNKDLHVHKRFGHFQIILFLVWFLKSLVVPSFTLELFEKTEKNLFFGLMICGLGP